LRKPSKSSPVGYEWIVKPLIEAAQKDALAELRAQVKPRLAITAEPK
jgi:hypothetical protein